MTDSRRYDLPIPFGWYAVSLSDEIAAGEVKTLRYFDRDIILFRTESGAASVLDAYCPHLGAHLGHGGKVQGESIACPFHGWQFNGDGMCTKVPYATRMPPRVVDRPCIRHYYAREDNGAIWAWYHPRGDAPHWELDHVPEMSDEQYWVNQEVREWFVDCHLQDTNENAVDKAHFAYVHISESVPEGQVTIDGHRRFTELASRTLAHDASGQTIEGEYIDTSFISKSFGPGFTLQQFMGVTNSVMMGTLTPIHQQRMHMRFVFRFPELTSDLARVFNQGYIDHVCQQVEQDIMIWNHKRYEPDPILCDGDGPIAQLRKWFSRFYADDA